VTALVLALTSVALALAWPWAYVCGLGLALSGLVNIPCYSLHRVSKSDDNLL